MDTYYCFFDRSAVDSFWKLSWNEFLQMHGKSRWARGQNRGDGAGSLRGLIAFAVEPEPSSREIEQILSRHTLRSTIRRSSPQFYMMEEIVYNVPNSRKFCASLDIWANDFTVLLAAAAEGYFRGEVQASELKTVLKLHYVKFEDFIRLSRQECLVLRRLMDVVQYVKPIYSWQGPRAILDEQWAGCLGVSDTKRFLKLLDRLWERNSEVVRLHDLEGIELYRPELKAHRFRDFGISRRLMNLWHRRVGLFKRPCIFQRGE